MWERNYSSSLNAFLDITNNLYWKPPGKGWSKEWIALSQFVLFIQKKRQVRHR